MRIMGSSSIFLGEKKTNIYYISEFSNVCYESGKFFLFGHAGSDINRIGSVITRAGMKQVEDLTVRIRLPRQGSVEV